MRERIKRAIPESWVPLIRRRLFQFQPAKIRFVHGAAGRLGYNISHRNDFCSPLPVLAEVERSAGRWFKPSSLVGVRYDTDAMKTLFAALHSNGGPSSRKRPENTART
jgi:hypothetical protein